MPRGYLFKIFGIKLNLKQKTESVLLLIWEFYEVSKFTFLHRLRQQQPYYTVKTGTLRVL